MNIAILGAGNGGCAAAGHLGRQGHRVRLFSPFEAELAPLRAQGGIRTEGAAGEGLVPLALVTDDPGQAVAGAEVIMVVVPTSTHEHYARLMAPHLKEGQVLFLNPGHTGGGLHFVHTLRSCGVAYEILCGETATLTYTCRLTEPGRVNIYQVLKRVPFAAFPGKHRDALLATLRQLYPALEPATNVLETGLLNLNAIEHPPGMLLNAGWIEATAGDFYFYYDGLTPAVARVLEALDLERLELAKALGFPPLGFLQFFAACGYTTEEAYRSGSVYRGLHESAPNRWLKAPRSLDHRYMHEDIGYGLVPMEAIASLAGVSWRVIPMLIDLACLLMGSDYRRHGRTLAKMGLEGGARRDLEKFLSEGRC